MRESTMTRRLTIPSSAARTGSSLIPSVIRYGSHSTSMPKSADANRNHGRCARSTIHSLRIGVSASADSASRMGRCPQRIAHASHTPIRRSGGTPSPACAA